MSLQVKLSTGTSLTRHKADDELTEQEIAEAVAGMAADPRVIRVQYLGRKLQGRTAVVIDAYDTQEGEFHGLYNVGRCLDALSETRAGYLDRVVRQHAERDPPLVPMTAREEQYQAERKDNLRRLEAAGFDPVELVDYVNRLVIGRCIEPDHPGSNAFGWYENEIVRGRPRPMQLGLYLANLIELGGGEFHFATD